MTEPPTPTLAEALEAARRAGARTPDDAQIAADDVGATAVAEEVGEDAETKPTSARKGDA